MMMEKLSTRRAGRHRCEDGAALKGRTKRISREKKTKYQENKKETREVSKLRERLK